MAERIFTMPDLGEGLEEGEIVAWLVAEGEAVELNQPLVEIETAKANVEIPSPFAGVVAVLHGAVGEAVAVGAPLVSFTAPEGGGEPWVPAGAPLRLPGHPQPRSAAPPPAWLPPLRPRRGPRRPWRRLRPCGSWPRRWGWILQASSGAECRGG